MTALVGPVRSDLRGGGTWTPLQRAKNDALWLAGTAAIGLARRASLQSLRVAGRLTGRAAHALGARARQVALDNVARVLPTLDARARSALVRRCFETQGELLGETVALLLSAGRPALIEVNETSRGALDEARAEGKGVVLASAHLGPWENVAASLVAAGVPLVAIVRESYDRRFDALHAELRRATGVRTIGRSSPRAPFEIVRALRRGEVLGVPMDLRSRVASIDVPFLGHPAPTPVGPARIALRTAAPVVVATVAPRTGPSAGTETEGYDAVVLEIVVTRVSTSDLRADAAGAAELTARINTELSARILALPHAWPWMHERWPAKRGYAGGG
ncbi:MAG: lysophospholipid acyltransferase family protein [Polyangiaceae bacterium]